MPLSTSRFISYLLYSHILFNSVIKKRLKSEKMPNITKPADIIFDKDKPGENVPSLTPSLCCNLISNCDVYNLLLFPEDLR